MKNKFERNLFSDEKTNSMTKNGQERQERKMPGKP
jgi:hypothetical protein